MVHNRTRPVVSSGSGVGSRAPTCAPSVPPFTVYYGLRRFLLVARSFSLDRRERPYRRLSATLILARNKPVQLHAGSGERRVGRAFLISPRVERQNIEGINSDVAIFDVSIGTPEFNELRPALRPGGIRVLDAGRFKVLGPLLEGAFHGCLRKEEAAALFSNAVHLAGEGGKRRDGIDGRVCEALEILDHSHFNELSPQSLAAGLGLSASRLRHLFHSELGCTPTHYQRWSATWRAAVLLPESESLTELAHQTGFYDLAHFDHAFTDTFGLPPSGLLDANLATLVPCL